MLPEEIRVQTGPIFQSYTIMAIGDVKLPYGEKLTGFSWKGFLPGKVREDSPYVVEWRNPHEIQGLWSMFRAKGRKLRLLVTETPINHDVYMGPYDVKYRGGYGDYYYSINLTQAKDIIISTSGGEGSEYPPLANKPQQERPEPPPAATHTVASGDTLWGIAQRELGAGSRYPEIFEANRDAIEGEAQRRGRQSSENGRWIWPGTVLTIPA
jgi:nucleoid-associated protein YgaU